MEDLVMIESKDYAQVIFEDVEECYTENNKLECFYSLNELLKSDSSDWIGIYKVGFSSYKDYVCKKEVNLISPIEDLRYKVEFDGEEIPKDDGEFYQFVYVSKSSQIRGASIPFQFKKTHITDFIQIEEPEAVVLKSKEIVINEELNSLTEKYEQIKLKNDSYEELLAENENIIKLLKDELNNSKLKCLKLAMDNEKLQQNQKLNQQEITSLSNERNSLNESLTNLEKEKLNLEKIIENLQQELTLNKDKLSATEQCKELLNSQINTLNSNLNLSDNKLKETTGSYYALKMANTHLEQRLNKNEQSKLKSEQENSDLKKQIEKLLEENEDLKQRIKAGAKEYTKLFDKYRFVKQLTVRASSSLSNIEQPQQMQDSMVASQQLVLEEEQVKKEEQKTCDICNFIFPTDSSLLDVDRHYSTHYGPSCPICNFTFRKGYPQSDFEMHVNSHFSN